MRILYHAINGVGLGHLMRLSAVAAAVRTRAPHAHQLIATSANYPPHFRRLDVPVMIFPDHEGGPSLSLDRRARCVSTRFAAKLLNHLVDEYDPQLVVFDTHAPHRVVRKVVDDGRRAALVFRACREEFLLRHLRQGSLAPFDLIVIPHSEEEFQAGLSRSTLTLLRRLRTVRYVGSIVFPSAADAAAQLEVVRRYGIAANSRLVVVTAGGGGLGKLNEQLYRSVCTAAVQLRSAYPDLQVICIGGPYARELLLPESCIYVPEEVSMQALLSRADIAVAIPGYNTVQEILSSGTPAILVPVRRKTEDLEARVDALQARGRVRRLELYATVEDYARCMDASLRAPRPQPETSNGAVNAAAELLGLASEAEYFICSKEPLAQIGAFSFDSPAKLVRALRGLTECNAIVRIDWDLVERLHVLLDEAAQSVIRKVEIILGNCDVEEAALRIRTVYSLLTSKGLPRPAVLFCVNDPSGGTLLAQLATAVRDLSFNALVGRVSAEALRGDPRLVFESLETCRDLQAGFKIDITLLDASTVFIDQP
jgi:UDP-N-acetylglucosamine--N-acetylmuramyl-(pentapeptide) pyrophosphoryl-undecaprenol N-acetylglucosamine transferase